KWACQIAGVRKTLHTRNIILGDTKTANILIDEATDNSKVIGFGGGNIEEWISPNLYSSAEGDLWVPERTEKGLADD
ncbi:hypothetical protein BJ875DRAFT_369796, partial [Amylocarpus encephaloides]